MFVVSGVAWRPARSARARQTGGPSMKHAVKHIHFVGSTAAKRLAIVMTAALAAYPNEAARR